MSVECAYRIAPYSVYTLWGQDHHTHSKPKFMLYDTIVLNTRAYLLLPFETLIIIGQEPKCFIDFMTTVTPVDLCWVLIMLRPKVILSSLSLRVQSCLCILSLAGRLRNTEGTFTNRH